MSHRAQQIAEAVKTALAANSSLGATAYLHRAASLDGDEIPAVSVRIGADTPTGEFGADNFAYIDSVLELVIEASVESIDEPTAIGSLLDIRRQVHITIMADRTLGLSFVMDTRYGGANEPQIDVASDQPVARLEMRYGVFYRMNISDPA